MLYCRISYFPPYTILIFAFFLIFSRIPVPRVTVDTKQGAEQFGMSRSSFASFHLTGIKPTGKMMTSSVDRLFENDGDVFLSNNFSEFQVRQVFCIISLIEPAFSRHYLANRI